MVIHCMSGWTEKIPVLDVCMDGWFDEWFDGWMNG